MKKTIRDVDVGGKRVLLRVDFNVPTEAGQITDDSRIRASLPTIQYLIERRARVIVLSHLDQPGGFVIEELRTDVLARRLADLLRQPVAKVNNSIGPEVHAAVRMLEPGQVLMLENVRFHPGEMVNDPHFAARLAEFADLYVNDAFASAHRNHASIVAITRYLPSVAGLLMENELAGLRKLQGAFRPPVVTLLGGARLVDKIRFFDDALEGENRLLLGGVLANTFLRAMGYETGFSRVEAEILPLVRSLLVDTRERCALPVDVVVATSPRPGARTKIVPANRAPATGYIVDVGPQTVEAYGRHLDAAGTVIWNGPVGISEIPEFAAGTLAIARRIAGLQNAVTLAGGGDTAKALDQAGVSRQINYISTGGAAFLSALQGDTLPGVAALEDKTGEETAPEDDKQGLQGARLTGNT